MMQTPAEIVARLDQYVIGQERAKRALAHAVVRHYMSVEAEGARVEKANVLLLGPTGSGKTFLVKTVANLLEVPYYATVATAIAPTGWMGEHAEDAVVRLHQRAKQRFGKDKAWEKSRRGIVYIDEVDKLALRQVGPQTSSATGADAKFNTIQVQQSLLRVIEGTEVMVDGNPLDTSGILFVGSGAFIGLEEDIKRRMAGQRFTRSAPLANPLQQVMPQDLVAYGLIQEFVGRFPVTAALNRLTRDDLVAVMREAKGGIVEQWRALLATRRCELVVDDLVLYLIADQALLYGTGARALMSIIEKRLEPVLYDLAPNTRVRMTAEGIEREEIGQTSEPRLAAGPAFAGEPLRPISEPEGTP